MEDEEFSVWCDKHLSDDSLDEDDDDEGDESQRWGGHVVDKISYLQHIHNFPLSFQNTFLQWFGHYSISLIVTLHGQKSFGKMGEKAITLLGTQGVNLPAPDFASLI